MADDPCTASLASTAIARNGSTQAEPAAVMRDPKVDCFYVYPTISDESTINSDLAIGFRQAEVAIAQASRFSQVCRVYAPVYRQITLSALDHPARITLADALIAYDSVLSAFRDYLAHYNHGRGIVFIGHSQGASILIKLLKDQVDPTPRCAAASSRRSSSAEMSPCEGPHASAATSSTFRSAARARRPAASSPIRPSRAKPPKNSQFGRTTSDAGVSLLAPHKLSPNIAIACVNPAAPAGGQAHSTRTFHRSSCSSSARQRAAGEHAVGRRSQVNTQPSAKRQAQRHGCRSGTRRNAPTSGRCSAELSDPSLGLHILDVNIALGNLVRLVRDEAAAYRG